MRASQRSRTRYVCERSLSCRNQGVQLSCHSQDGTAVFSFSSRLQVFVLERITGAGKLTTTGLGTRGDRCRQSETECVTSKRLANEIETNGATVSASKNHLPRQVEIHRSRAFVLQSSPQGRKLAGDQHAQAEACATGRKKWRIGICGNLSESWKKRGN